MTIDDLAGPTADDLPPGAEVTLKDIARLAGVSVATASRVINRTGLVAPAKLQAVEAVLAKFSYIPNNAARALIKRRSMTVGLIVPTMANPVFAPAIEGIEARLQAAGYGLLIACSQRDPDKELAQARTMLERGVDGLILTGSHHRDELLPLVHSRGIATIIQDDPVGAEGVRSLAMQDAAAMATAIDALVEAGHRRIAILTGPTGNTRPIAERLRGAVERLRHHGIAVSPEDIAETPDYEAATARPAVRRLLARRPAYTAIACTGDILAISVMIECRRAGLRVPDDLSLIGCGDTVMAQFVDPPLTTVHLPFRGMGEAAATLLLAEIDRQPSDTPRAMDFHLVERETVRRL
ncbi:LacI family DNA-binding transcriptional regulator [Telmatospirillum sp. J64-1]|uniref:LacI family DNA-binding transcriptional regulator n=1 Tax=Telmatospirillum sp. J64-1 TaxID=2502183 RepID=UPI00115F4AAF|nr:LacI family DNA-binding transcriptional regulator [Telmatospirillum sp. J64-1]